MSSSAEFNAQTVAVFGGGNGWGKLILETFDSLNSKTYVVEKDSTHDEIISAIQSSEIIFIAIPDSDIQSLLENYGDKFHNKIVLDCATNKSGFSDELIKLAITGVSVCSTHPMAASNGVLHGQNALIMPIGENALQAKAVAEQLYQHLGMQCAVLDFNKHTDVMCLVQMLPHVIQRLTIDAVGQGLLEYDIPIAALENLASANYLLAELALGRVAAQRSDVSAGIIATALSEPTGQKLVERLQSSLQNIKRASNSREALSDLFNASVQQLDPSGAWRLQMADKTEAALIRLGNLRSRTLTIEAPNRIGMLRDILSVLAKHQIDMTALDSQLISKADSSEWVNFDIAISNETVPFSAMIDELAVIDARFVK
jgi:prephenate dehydrogenase